MEMDCNRPLPLHQRKSEFLWIFSALLPPEGCLWRICMDLQLVWPAIRHVCRQSEMDMQAKESTWQAQKRHVWGSSFFKGFLSKQEGDTLLLSKQGLFDLLFAYLPSKGHGRTLVPVYETVFWLAYVLGCCRSDLNLNYNSWFSLESWNPQFLLQNSRVRAFSSSGKLGQTASENFCVTRCESNRMSETLANPTNLRVTGMAGKEHLSIVSHWIKHERRSMTFCF